MDKWNINLHECPNTNEEIKNWVLEKLKNAMWTKQPSRKKNIMSKNLTPSGNMMKRLFKIHN